MYTTMMVVALSGFAAHANGDSLTWLNDYSLARSQGQMEQKPVAVFVGTGAEGWQKLAKSGKLGKDAAETLQSRYVCVYVDTATAEGKKLAATLGVGRLGIVISDRSGGFMAFYHEGDLADADLSRYLVRYSDWRAFSVTETNPSVRQSFYPPNTAAPAGRSC